MHKKKTWHMIQWMTSEWTQAKERVKYMCTIGFWLVLSVCASMRYLIFAVAFPVLYLCAYCFERYTESTFISFHGIRRVRMAYFEGFLSCWRAHNEPFIEQKISGVIVHTHPLTHTKFWNIGELCYIALFFHVADFKTNTIFIGMHFNYSFFSAFLRR